MIGFDLVIVGGGLGFLGSLILAKSYLKPAFQEESRQSFFGQNPYLARNQIVQRVEAFTGTFWLVLGFFSASVGTVVTASRDTKEIPVDYWLHFGTWLAVTFVLFWASLRYASQVSRKEYLPLMVYILRESYQQCVGYVSKGGLEEHELQRQDITQDIRDQRMAICRRNLDQIGRLTDTPRQPLELDRDYMRRLEALFAGR